MSLVGNDTETKKDAEKKLRLNAKAPSHKVLLVEDNEGDAFFVKKLLREFPLGPLAILHTTSLGEAKEIVRTESPDAVLLDLNLHDSRGESTFTGLVEIAPGLPVVILSGLGEEGLALGLISKGAYGYLKKDELSHHTLFSTLFNCIRRHEVELELKAKTAAVQRESEALKVSETQLRSLADALPALISFIDRNLVYVFNNNQYEEWFGWGQEDIQGKRLTDVFGQEYVEGIAPQIKQALSGQIASFEREHIHRLKGPRINHVTFVPCLEGNGEVRGFYVLANDITELRHMEKQREHLAAIVDSSQDAVVGKTIEGRILSWNAGAERIYGFSAQEVIGGHIDPTVPVGRSHSLQEIYRRVFEGEMVKPFETIRVTKSGERLSVLVSLSPIKEGNGKVVGISSIEQDIGVRKKMEIALRESEQKFRQLADSMPQIVWTARPDGVTEYFNRRWHEYTGVVAESENKWHFIEVIHPDDKERAKKDWDSAVREKRNFEAEYRFKDRHTGDYRWFLGRAVPIFDESENIVRWYGTCTDIHDQKLAESRLSQAKEVAEKANRAKSDFLANMSHEIRTPLTAIVGFSEIMVTDDCSREERGEYVSRIQSNARHLKELIDDILDLSKVEAGKIEIDKVHFPIATELREVLEILRSQAGVKGLQMHIHIDEAVPANVYTDPVKLRQIVNNIVGNAIKFTDQGTIDIGVRLLQKVSSADAQVELLVTDTGTGLTPLQRGKIFQPFVQADSSSTRAHGGTGLGLVLSRKLARALGGDVELLESTPGKGSTFRITIGIGPLVEEKEKLPTMIRSAIKPGAEISTEIRTQFKGMRVLVVEDSEEILLLIHNFLEFLGAKCQFAENGKKGVEQALQLNPDIILMDIQMPVMDGYAATRILREKGFKKPIVALTARILTEEKENCLAAGCDDCVAKPFNLNTLIEALQRGKDYKLKHSA